MKSFAKSAEPPFASDGGLGALMPRDEDAFAALDDLMAAVEALCPVWPPRAVFVDGGKILL